MRSHSKQKSSSLRTAGCKATRFDERSAAECCVPMLTDRHFHGARRSVWLAPNPFGRQHFTALLSSIVQAQSFDRAGRGWFQSKILNSQRFSRNRRMVRNLLAFSCSQF